MILELQITSKRYRVSVSNQSAIKIFRKSGVTDPSYCSSFQPLQALGFTQRLTEMNTRNRKIITFLGSKVRPVCRANNLTAICDPIVYTMWDP
jgi:predicted transcriptional regulator